jgi:predicted metal-dependent phosphoesterase TrpH
MSIPKDTTTDVAIEQQAAEQLHVEIIPGTEVMTDVGNSHLAKAGGNGSV